MVDLMIAAGAPVDRANRDGVTPPDGGGAREGQLAPVQALLAAGADPSRLDFSGRSVLGWAQQARNRAVVDALRAGGAT